LYASPATESSGFILLTLNAALQALSMVRISPFVQGFWLGYVRYVIVGGCLYLCKCSLFVLYSLFFCCCCFLQCSTWQHSFLLTVPGLSWVCETVGRECVCVTQGKESYLLTHTHAHTHTDTSWIGCSDGLFPSCWEQLAGNGVVNIS
jgi:hypothetical protein